MGLLHLYAISINDVRDMFSADDELAELLRAVYNQHFRLPPSDYRVKRSLLSKLAPLTRKPSEPITIPEGHPLPADLEALIAGRAVPPERLRLAWLIIEKWLDAQSFVKQEIELTATELSELDFDLSLAGLSSKYSVSALLNDALGIPYRCPVEVKAGYHKNGKALDWRHSLTLIVNDVDPRSIDAAKQLLLFLNDFDTWTDSAAADDRHLPDLVAVFESDK